MRHQITWLVLIILSMSAVSSFANEQPMLVRFSAPASDYIAELVVLALDKSGVSYRCEAVKNVPSQTRAIRLLGKENGIDLSWHVTNYDLEEQAKAVLIPIDKGLLGYRIAVVRSDTPDLFANMNSRYDMRNINFGLGFDWADLAIFRDNGIKTTQISDNNQHFNMLSLGRFDALPLSVLELNHTELTADTMFDEHVVIRYPSATYFFVAKENKALHSALTQGLKQAAVDGSWQQLFDKHFAKHIQAAHLEERRIIELENKTLPSTAPLDEAIYWYSKK